MDTKLVENDKDRIKYQIANVYSINNKRNNNSYYAIINEDSSSTNSQLKSITPFASLIKYAQKYNIPLSGINLGSQNSKPSYGDEVTLLITLIDGDESEEWLSIIKQDSLTKKEQELSPLPENVIYTSTGRILKFKNTRTALDVFFVGPFTFNGNNNFDYFNSQLKKPYRLLLSEEQLNLGLDKYGRSAIGLTERGIKANAKEEDLFYIGASSPLSKDQLKRGQKYLNLIHPNEAEERIRFSVSLALDNFLSAALKINSFNDLLDKVLNRPSIWSVITNLGASRGLFYNPADVKQIDAKNIGINLIAYKQPIRLDINNEPALNAFIIMTEARPPLQNCAGIVKIYAENPFDRRKKLIIQVNASDTCESGSQK